MNYHFFLHTAEMPNLLNWEQERRGILNTDDGTITPVVNGRTTEFIAIEEQATYNIVGDGILPRNVRICFYDNKCHFIRSVVNETTFVTDIDDVYVRISMQTTSLRPFAVGRNLTNYVPYWLEVHPIYPSALSLDTQRESQQMFYRTKLNGKLTFVRGDYDFIQGQPFATRFEVRLTKDDMLTYWRGAFTIVDCEVNYDDRTIVVTPDVLDEYSDILSRQEEELDLIAQNVDITRIGLQKRSIFQFYWRGSDKVTCVLGNMYWEQDAEEVDDVEELQNVYGFAQVLRDPTTIPPLNDDRLWCRMITDATLHNGVYTDLLPPNDITSNNRNYHRMLRYQPSPDTIYHTFNEQGEVHFWDGLSTSPTEWGNYQPKLYYTKPSAPKNWIPIARYNWTKESVWFSPSDAELSAEEDTRKKFSIRDGYALSDVIKGICKVIAPTLSHDAIASDSQFFYSEVNPITNEPLNIYLTPKSNALVGDYTQSAQKSPITWKKVADMLRDAFQCYWFVENGRVRIEHIKYFKNGGSYDDEAIVGIDVTTMMTIRTNVPFTRNTNTIKYNKDKQPETFTFSWMDDCTPCFEGERIKINSAIVDKSRSEKVSVANFTTDIDYMLANPNDCSKDGYAMFNCIGSAESYIEEWSEFQPVPQVFEPTSLLVQLPSDIPMTDVTLNFATRNVGEIGGVGTGIQFFLIGISGRGYVSNSIVPNELIEQGVTLSLQNAKEQVVAISISLFGVASCDIRVISLIGQPQCEVKRVPIPKLPNEFYYVQNGDLSFVKLVELYRYDLPDYDIEMNLQKNTALDIRRTKVQSITFPLGDREIDPTELIRTEIGDGEVEKVSLNLSSRSVKAELNFKTH